MSLTRYHKMRSVLFVGGNNVKALNKAVSGATGADWVIVDLEDAVGPLDKDTARANVLEAVVRGQPNANIAVRLNAYASDLGQRDYAAFRDATSIPLVFPKVELSTDLPQEDPSRIWAMLETASGVLNAPSLAKQTSVLVAGTQDLSADLRIPMPMPSGRAPLLHSLSHIILAARSAGVVCLDGVSVNYKDLTPFVEEAKQGAMLGFDGKTLIHPAQVSGAHEAFSPSAEAMKAAQDIVSAWSALGEEGVDHPGIATLNGKLIEKLHHTDALRILCKGGSI